MWLRSKIQTTTPTPTKHYTSWRLFSILVVGFMVFSALAVSYFIYQNIFATLANANDIAFLKTSITIDAVDKKAYDAATKLIELKRNIVIPSDTKNIFEYGPEPKTNTSTKTTR